MIQMIQELFGHTLRPDRLRAVLCLADCQARDLSRYRRRTSAAFAGGPLDREVGCERQYTQQRRRPCRRRPDRKAELPLNP